MVSGNENGYRLKCSSCGATYLYSMDKLDDNGSVECQNCAARILTDSGFGDSVRLSILDQDAIVPSRETSLPSVEGLKIKCPNCFAKYIYKDYHRLEDGRVKCQNCGMVIDAIGEDVLIFEAPMQSESSGNAAIICLLIILILFVPWIIAVPLIICIVMLKGINDNQGRDEDRKIVRQDAQGPGPR